MIHSKRIQSPKLRKSAKGQPCTLNVVGICNYNQETTVLAHINCEGGAIGIKTDDTSACYACSDCHSWIDQHKGSIEDELFYTRRAMVRTWAIWVNEGVVKI